MALALRMYLLIVISLLSGTSAYIKPVSYNIEPSRPNYYKIFHKCWFPLCQVNDTSKSRLHRVDFFDESICIIKHGDTFEAFSNWCPHRMASLAHGALRDGGTLVECPYHGFTFDVCSGNAVEIVPNYDKKTNMCMKKYPIQLYDNTLWTTLGESPWQIREELDETLESVYGHRVLDNAAFLIMENLLDALHLRTVHSFGNSVLPTPFDIEKHESGVSFKYHTGKRSPAQYMQQGTKSLQVLNEFDAPYSATSNVLFGNSQEFAKVVRVHLLPISEEKTIMFWGIHRNFFKQAAFNPYVRFLMEYTIDEDQAILKHLKSADTRQKLIEYDYIISKYRKSINDIIS